MPFTRSQSQAATALGQSRNDLSKEPQSSPEDGASGNNAFEAGTLLTHRTESLMSAASSMCSIPKSARSINSSHSTIKAQMLAAKAEHARRLAEVEEERERHLAAAEEERYRRLAEAEAERERIRAERERVRVEREHIVANLELQAKLAAIDAGTSCRSNRSHRSSHRSVENWLAQSHDITARPKRDNKACHLIDREGAEPSRFYDERPQPPPRSAPPVTTLADACTTLPIPSCLCPSVVAPAEPITQTLDLGSGTLAKENNCYVDKNKNYEENVGSPYNQLANAIASLGKKTAQKVCDISKFDGRVTDWFLFKKSYDQSKSHFSPGQNVARLSAALGGAAKEAVAVRLIAADDPEQIVKALENRFAQPEVIVLHQLALVRALPKLGFHENSRDLNVFACRIRNCIDVIRLLDQPEYLASPELSNSIVGKLTPLLRSRWADFASTRAGSGKFKLETLADFLENESYLQIKFGLVMSEPTLAKSQPVKPIKDSIFPHAVSSSSGGTKGKEQCKYCQKGSHDIEKCSTFQSLSVEDRWQWALDNKVCRKCLRKGSHNYQSCKKRCEVDGCIANRKHHTLLHKSTSAIPATVLQLDEPTATVAHNSAPPFRKQPLLKVIPVTLTGKKGSIDTFALLDDGSSATLLEKSVADLLDDEGPREPLRIHCIGGLTKLSNVCFVNIKVKGRYTSESYDIRARSIPNLDLRVQSATIGDVSQYDYLTDLADVLTYRNAKPTCLIGTDNWHLLLAQSIRHGTKAEPAAALTPLGWVLFGFINTKANSVEFINHVEVDEMDHKLDILLKNYYKLDSIGIEKKLHRSPSDKRALEILDGTTVRLPSGRFQTGLLWRNDIKIVPESKRLALSRFSSLECKMTKDETYALSYKQNIQAMIDKGYAELCPGPASVGAIVWYLPHFGVVHPHKKKLRVVHDAAAKCNGVSLNSMLGLDWDHKLPEILISRWKSWFQELECLSGSTVPRCYSGDVPIVDCQLHVFSDASELAYACVAYWRFILADGSTKLTLIGGKARLAPLKPTTIPRLELQAALIAARLANYITEAHRRKPSKYFMWSDSITVLKWLRSDTCTFKPFVAFRVAEISELTDICSWRYVPTGLNVADDATRNNGDLSIYSRWFTGPPFLLSSEATWPSEPTPDKQQPTADENKTISEVYGCLVNASTEPFAASPIVADYRRFSRWVRLLRATARVHQSAKVFRSLLPQNSNSVNTSLRCNRNLPLLSVNELNSAELHLFMVIQRDSFSDELSCVHAGRPVSNLSRLKNVSLFLGEDGLLRLSGRTSASDAIESHPTVLDGKHEITRLLIDSYHVLYAHANNELVVNELRQRLFIVGLRPAVKHVASRCQACRIRKAKPMSPPIGDLPEARMAHNERPFTYVGLDYFGPLTVTIGRRHAKRWVALFTCLTIRAIHLEIVESLSSDSAIMALRRFIARRGCPSCIYSDNGTAFVGAAKIIADVYEFASTKRVHWKFIPPSAPFMGGCWERLVRNVKNALVVTLKDRSPREEAFQTLLMEAEAIVNSRPLTHVPVDHDAEEALTPFSLLIGSTSNDLQTRRFDDSDLSSRAQWRKAQHLADHFWQRFVHEYLPTLVPRRSSPAESRTVNIGDLVCIVDGTLPRRCWPRGRVVATYPGKDNIVRVVDVATKGGVLRRPVKKLALLVVT